MAGYSGAVSTYERGYPGVRFYNPLSARKVERLTEIHTTGDVSKKDQSFVSIDCRGLRLTRSKVEQYINCSGRSVVKDVNCPKVTFNGDLLEVARGKKGVSKISELVVCLSKKEGDKQKHMKVKMTNANIESLEIQNQVAWNFTLPKVNGVVNFMFSVPGFTMVVKDSTIDGVVFT